MQNSEQRIKNDEVNRIVRDAILIPAAGVHLSDASLFTVAATGGLRYKCLSE